MFTTNKISFTNEYLATCPAGIRCPHRSAVQVESSRAARLCASNTILKETQMYLQQKCDGKSEENNHLRSEILQLRHELAVEQRKRNQYLTSSNTSINTSLGQRNDIEESFSGRIDSDNPVKVLEREKRELLKNYDQSLADRMLLLEQVKLMQDAIDRLTEMNEKLLKNGSHHDAIYLESHDGNRDVSDPNTFLDGCFPSDINHINQSEIKERNAWGVAMVAGSSSGEYPQEDVANKKIEGPAVSFAPLHSKKPSIDMTDGSSINLINSRRDSDRSKRAQEYLPRGDSRTASQDTLPPTPPPDDSGDEIDPILAIIDNYERKNQRSNV